jgi:predicted metal-dependent phosphoesterase TrpH
LRAILPSVDAIEVFNARILGDGPNRRAADLAAEVGLPGTVGSDAHAALELGRAVMLMEPFSDGFSFLQALPHAVVRTQRSSAAVHVLSRLAAWRWRLGWRPPA